MVQERTTSKLLLHALADVLQITGETVIELGEFYQALQSGYGSAFQRGGAGYVAELKRLARQHRVAPGVRVLRRSNYLEARRVGKRIELSLTDKGRRETLAQQLRQGRELPAGAYTLVCFDIPRSENHARRRFRLLLRQAGFTRLQHSVWISSRDCYTTIVKFVRQQKLTSWVNVLRANEVLVPPRKISARR